MNTNTAQLTPARFADLTALIAATIRCKGIVQRDDLRNGGFSAAQIDAWADAALAEAIKASPPLAHRLAESLL
jgi:hypothetical protein